MIRFKRLHDRFNPQPLCSNTSQDVTLFMVLSDVMKLFMLLSDVIKLFMVLRDVIKLAIMTHCRGGHKLFPSVVLFMTSV